MKFPGNAGASVPAYTNNVKVFRLSEAVLIAAEASLKTGGDPSVYINLLRRNRILGYQDVDEVSLEDILDERRKELFAEGQIAFDFWRNGLPVVKDGITVGPQDGKIVLQIPKEEIDLAKGRIKQNPM